ncbi:hypothetical protein KIN20_027778 [Parelaphostrongylus tenuis]|uniref:Uncharacterized protein n=1 Tax=Parelaphostrongylus tenuis TaxID=148309 RepID=A0AAD5QZZ9_PARTN|nr:hypothetical protein KIN20_027778 [Parelaphostrongylus tenuis]
MTALHSTGKKEGQTKLEVVLDDSRTQDTIKYSKTQNLRLSDLKIPNLAET